MSRRAPLGPLCALALLSPLSSGCGEDAVVDASVIVDLAVPVDLAVAPIADATVHPDLAPPPELTPPPDLITPPDLYVRPNPLTLWLSFRGVDENDLILIDDPNPPLF